jgi:hypothetical protein
MESEWMYTQDALSNTPSRRDGVDKHTEQRYKREGMEFIKTMANSLKL